MTKNSGNHNIYIDTTNDSDTNNKEALPYWCGMCIGRDDIHRSGHRLVRLLKNKTELQATQSGPQHGRSAGIATRLGGHRERVDRATEREAMLTHPEEVNNSTSTPRSQPVYASWRSKRPPIL